MPFLKLHRDEPEAEAPAPLPFKEPDRRWRQAGESSEGADRVDSIKQVEKALRRVERAFGELSKQVDEYAEPIQLSEWLDDDDDDGPWAA